MASQVGLVPALLRARPRPVERLDEAIGGSARRRVVVLLACVLALQAADTGAIGALAAPLEHAFRIGNARLGLVVTVSTLVGCAATLPFGSVVDSHSRTLLLQVVIAGWALTTVVSAMSVSFSMLLVSRLALGIVVAAAAPAVTSLVGDLFPGDERGRMWGFVLTGEFIGAGAGILVAGTLSSWAGWRVALGVLALPAVLLVWCLRRGLPEPARGGQSRIEAGADSITAAGDVDPDQAADAAGAKRRSSLEEPALAEQQAEQAGATADAEIVRSGAEDLSMWRAVGYVVRVRTNLALIVASGFGYFFFGGLQTFGELYLRERTGAGQSVASMLFILIAAGALAGVLSGGRVADRLIRHGRTTARLEVAAVAFVATTGFFVAGALTPMVAVSIAILFVSAAALGAVNPPADAARLDVLPSFVWGRGEAVRTAFRQLLQGVAPLLFGVVSADFGAPRGGLGAGINTNAAHVANGASHGLELAFIIFSAPLVAAGAVLWASRGRYLQDLVTVRRAEERHAAGEGR
ncbi:MAG: MFS transporter [Acidimicrobiaceae bacterium]|nr:MFS transporter [Acidimicrobiaceae bacterium]